MRRLMREDNLLAIRRRKFVVTNDSDHPFRVYPNLAQHLVLSDVNPLWVADLTYLRLLREFVYLAVVLGLVAARGGMGLGAGVGHPVACSGAGTGHCRTPAATT